MVSPEQLPVMDGLPELMRFENGEKVKTPEDWIRRRKELLALYSEYMYGRMPDPSREALAWSLKPDPETGISVCRPCDGGYPCRNACLR